MKRLIYPWRNLATRIRQVARYWKALNRLSRGLCPRCNSDACEMDRCPLCYGWWRSGTPPENDRRLIWHNKFLTEDRYEERKETNPPHPNLW